jgi:hypothetical protein
MRTSVHRCVPLTFMILSNWLIPRLYYHVSQSLPSEPHRKAQYCKRTISIEEIGRSILRRRCGKHLGLARHFFSLVAFMFSKQKRPLSSTVDPRLPKRLKGSMQEGIPSSAQKRDTSTTRATIWHMTASTRALAGQKARRAGRTRQTVYLDQPWTETVEELPTLDSNLPVNVEESVAPASQTEDSEKEIWKTFEILVPLPPKRKRKQRNDSVRRLKFLWISKPQSHWLLYSDKDDHLAGFLPPNLS